MLNLKIDPVNGVIKLEKNLDAIQELSAAQIAWIIKSIQSDLLTELRKIEKNKLTGRKMPNRNRYAGTNEESQALSH